jgi:hypothetical protein
MGRARSRPGRVQGAADAAFVRVRVADRVRAGTVPPIDGLSRRIDRDALSAVHRRRASVKRAGAAVDSYPLDFVFIGDVDPIVGRIEGDAFDTRQRE